MKRKSRSNGWGIAVLWLCLVQLLVLAGGCRKEVLPPKSEVESVEGFSKSAGYAGVYVLNSGGEGSNETTLDFLDFADGTYHRNIYAENNPDKVASLGDNGVDLAVHEGRLYISVNKSHRVEILDAYTAKHLARVSGINDSRYFAFDDKGNGYVTSYLAPGRNSVAEPRGEVVRFSTQDGSLGEITGRVSVGYQPEHMLVLSETGQMFVTCSGMYNRPQCDDRLYEVDLNGFRVSGSLKIATNLDLITPASTGVIWVSARGNMLDQSPCVHKLSLKREEVDGQLLDRYDVYLMKNTKGETDSQVDVKILLIDGMDDRAKVALCGELDLNTRRFINTSFNRVNTINGRLTPLELEVADQIQSPVSLAVADNGDIYVGDAKNYNSSGMLYCFDRNGKLKWKVRTGIIPTKIVFLPAK